MKAIINVRCPGCGGALEIDVSRERVLSHRKKLNADKSEDKEALFDEVVQRVQDRGAENEEKFDKARAQEKDKEKRMDDLFDDVKKKVAEEKEKGDPGPNPRDLFWD